MSAAAEPARFTLAALVDRFGGSFAGDAQRVVTGFAPLRAARPDQLAFATAGRFRDDVAATAAAAVLVTAKDAHALVGRSDRLWVCTDPYLQFARIAQWFEAANRGETASGVDPTAVVAADAIVDPAATIGARAIVGSGARIAAGATVGAGAHVGAASRIGAASVLHPGVVVYHGCTIGARCVVHAGAVIGSDGFGFARDGRRWVKIPQTGGVVIGDDVEVGANTTIDRGTLDDTRIGDGVKLDNQIQIAHNVQVGDDSIMAAFVGVAGSAVIGKRCMIGGAARIMGHVTIADDTVVSTQTFVSRSITKAGHYTGYYPMAEHAAFEKSAAVLRRLDGLRDRVRRVERAIEAEGPPPTEPERPA